jgi:allantoinase
MPAEHRYVFPDPHYGMDHEHYDWSPLNANRVALEWPGNARVALCVIVNLGHVEWRHPTGSYQPPNLAGGYGPGPFPDVTAWSHREYGHRVGIFRVLDVLDKYGVNPTIAMDALTAEHYPFLVRHSLGRGGEIIAHGISDSQMITSRMSEQEEQEYIRTSMRALTHATGKAPLGWLGPQLGESPRTPQLLAQSGIRYVCDWVNDEHLIP